MKFSIKRSAFVNSLNIVSRAISPKTTIPILTGLKIVANDDGLILTGSNADISIETKLKAANADIKLAITNPGAIVLPARFFSNIVKKLPQEMMTLDVTDNFQTRITSGSSSFDINGLDPSNYPHLPEIDSYSSISLSGDIFKEIIQQTVIAVSDQESRPILNGVHFVLSDNQLLAVATDSHRLSQRKVKINDNQNAFDFIIPGDSLVELSRMIKEHQDIQMRISENQVLFTLDETSFYSRLLEGNYPDTSRLIPTTSTTDLQFEAPILLAAIERASLLSHESRNNVVKFTLKPSQNLATISGNSPDVGKVEENLSPDSMDGDDLTISFNPDYMKDALRSFGKSMIKIAFTSPLRPFTLTPTEDKENFVQLITPVRTF